MSCVDNVFEALGGKATKKQIQAWVDKINEQGQYDPSTLMQQVTEFGREKLHQAYMRKRNTALLLQKERQVYDYITANFKDSPTDGLLAVLGGVQSHKAGARYSAYVQQQTIRSAYINDLQLNLTKSDVYDEFASGEIDGDVAKELADINSQTPSKSATSSVKAKEIARILKEAQDKARMRANAAGADIKELEGYFMTQTHDMYKIRKVDAEKWINDVMSRIDVKKTFGDTAPKEIRDILNVMHNNLASGDHIKIDFGDPVLSTPKKTSNIGGGLSKSRVLHFLSPEKSLEYNKLYGIGNLRENVFGNIAKLADKTGLMETVGPNPSEVIDRVYAQLKANSDKAAQISLADRKKEVADLLSVLDGTTNTPGRAMWAKWGSILRGIQTMSKLGGAVITSVTDLATSASELVYQGNGFLSSYHSAIVGPYNSLPKQVRKELALQLGIINDAMVHDLIGLHSGREDFSGKTSRAVNQFFRWNGLTGWTNRLRANMAMAMSGRLGSLAGKEFSKLEPELQRILGQFNIQADDWKALSKAVRQEGEYTFVVPEAVSDISDAEISKIFSQHPTQKFKTPEKIKQELSDKLRAYYIDRSEHAVLMPDARTQAWLKRGTRPGTVEGELFRSIMQFKAFPVTFIQKVFGRERYGYAEGSSIMGFAHVIASTTAFGYGAMVAKDLLKGKEPRDPRDPKTIMAAMLQGGALGIYGDFILGTSNRFGGTIMDTAAGPLLGEITKAATVLMAIRDGDDPSAQGLKMIQGNAPFINMFYLRAALDYAIMYRMQEAISPGYLRRMEQRAKRDNNQEFIIPPSQVIPRGGF